MFSLPPYAGEVLEKLEAAGVEAWCVGGCVRDALLGRAPADWDVCTSARPELTKKALAEGLLRRLRFPNRMRKEIMQIWAGNPLPISQLAVQGRDLLELGFQPGPLDPRGSSAALF